jgi:hypothetical protein
LGIEPAATQSFGERADEAATSAPRLFERTRFHGVMFIASLAAVVGAVDGSHRLFD